MIAGCWRGRRLLLDGSRYFESGLAGEVACWKAPRCACHPHHALGVALWSRETCGARHMPRLPAPPWAWAAGQPFDAAIRLDWSAMQAECEWGPITAPSCLSSAHRRRHATPPSCATHSRPSRTGLAAPRAVRALQARRDAALHLSSDGAASCWGALHCGHARAAGPQRADAVRPVPPPAADATGSEPPRTPAISGAWGNCCGVRVAAERRPDCLMTGAAAQRCLAKPVPLHTPLRIRLRIRPQAPCRRCGPGENDD